MSKKEELIQTIEALQEGQTIRTHEILSTGENNRMMFMCSIDSLLRIIDTRFDDNLQGLVPGGVATQIIDWEIVDKTL